MQCRLRLAGREGQGVYVLLFNYAERGGAHGWTF